MGDPNVPYAPILCRYLDLETQTWVEFKRIFFYIQDTEEIILKHKNIETDSQKIMKINIEYSYNLSFAKFLPSDLFGKKEDLSGSELSKSRKELLQKEYPCLVIFKNLDKKRRLTNLVKSIKRKESVPRSYVPQYHILSFELLDPQDTESYNYVRRKISTANFLLKYNENGLRFHIAERVRLLTYKAMKQALVLLGRLVGISAAQPRSKLVSELFDYYDDPSNQRRIKEIVSRLDMLGEIRSIVYKTITTEGFFPSFVEMNTMGESSVFLWMKKLFTNQVTAPWGSSHHASITIGNHRYSFINDPSDVSMMNKVNVTLDLRRNYWNGDPKRNYFRIKFFDFFPMDNWTHYISKFIVTLLPIYKVLEDDDAIKTIGFWKALEMRIHQAIDKEKFAETIAKEFVIQYKDFFFKVPTKTKQLLKINNYDKVFLKFTDLIVNAEMRGYRSFSNNCQTMVSDVVKIFCLNLQDLLEPLSNQMLILAEDTSVYRVIKQNFASFGSIFNRSLKVKVQPFSLIHRLSYFDMYSDEDTYKLFLHSNFDNLCKKSQRYLKGEAATNLMTAVNAAYEDGMIRLKETLDIPLDLEELLRKTELEPEDLKKTLTKEEKLAFILQSDAKGQTPANKKEEFSHISHLLYLMINTLFTLRKQIAFKKEQVRKLKKEKKEKESMDSLEVSTLKKSTLEIQRVTEELKAMYQEKYQAMQFYQEVCYYYYNSVRLGLLAKLTNSLTCFGFLIARDPTELQEPQTFQPMKIEKRKQKTKEPVLKEIFLE